MADNNPALGARRTWKNAFDFVTTLLTIAAAAAVLWLNVLQPQILAAARNAVPAEPLSIKEAAVKGDPHAAIAIIEYSDFQCPYCGKFSKEILPLIETKYISTGKAIFVFEHLPLTAIHSRAAKAAEATECAGQSGKFWEMHDLVFAHQKELDEPSLVRLGVSLGLDGANLSSCLGGVMTAKVQQSANDASALGISTTPTFLIGKVQQPSGSIRVLKRLNGASSIEDFDRSIMEAAETREVSVSQWTLIVGAAGLLVVGAGIFVRRRRVSPR